VDNRALVQALAEAVRTRGGEVREHAAVEAIEIADGRVQAVRVAPEHRAETPESSLDGREPGRASRGAKRVGERLPCSRVVLAAGAWSRKIGGLPEAIRPPVRPVKGQIVALRRTEEFPLAHVIRAPDAYLLPKPDGRVLVGASEEDMGFDLSPTAGAVLRLLERGWEAVPAIFDLPLEGVEVGLRPGSRDHQPLIGPTPIEGLFYATGHYRHGILLTPITARLLEAAILEGKVEDRWRPFLPDRFFAG